jgi:hypothetical protein
MNFSVKLKNQFLSAPGLAQANAVALDHYTLGLKRHNNCIQ